MTFDYNTLKKAARDGLRLGNWNGKAVFAASASTLENRGSGAYYILYDDENKIVARDAAGWKSYGVVTEQGSVNEYSGGCRTYTILAEAKKEKASATYTPGYDRAERPMGDVKLEIDVEKTLKSAREMTVESLLGGFLSGVMAKG